MLTCLSRQVKYSMEPLLYAISILTAIGLWSAYCSQSFLSLFLGSGALLTVFSFQKQNILH